MLRQRAIATDGEAADKDTSEDGHEVSDVHGHDGQHPAENGNISVMRKKEEQRRQ
jgi:hypothetical protein